MRLDEFQALSLHPLQKRNALWVFRFEKKWRPLRPFKSCKIFNVFQVCLTRLDSTSAALKYLLPIKSAISKRSATVSTLKRPTIIWSNPNNQRSTVNNACVTMCHSMHAFPQDKLANLGQQLQIATVSLPAHSAQPGQALHNDVQPPNSQGSRDPKFSQSWTTATTWLAREGILENDTCHSCHVMYSTWSSRRFTVLQGRQVEDKLKTSQKLSDILLYGLPRLQQIHCQFITVQRSLIHNSCVEVPHLKHVGLGGFQFFQCQHVWVVWNRRYSRHGRKLGSRPRPWLGSPPDPCSMVSTEINAVTPHATRIYGVHMESTWSLWWRPWCAPLSPVSLS